MSTLLKVKEPIAKTSLAESVYQRILEAILSGTLAGGTELSEVALAAELGVSRTPVHEALLRLAADGLVEDLASRQARVARFTRQDLANIYEVRRILEPAAAELAATRMTDEQLAELRAAADALDAAKDKRDWANRAIDFDLRFTTRSPRRLATSGCGRRSLNIAGWCGPSAGRPARETTCNRPWPNISGC